MIWFFIVCVLYSWNVGIKDLSKIIIFPDRISHRISPYTTGANIEDVNHEIYGGIYSQMIFGERFEEPPAISEIMTGFQQYGGSWNLQENELSVLPALGPKIIAENVTISSGRAGVEMYFAGTDQKQSKAGILLRLGNPATPPNHFNGYEISLVPGNGTVILSRHQYDDKRLAEKPCNVPMSQWISLSVNINKNTMQIFVNNVLMLSYSEDQEYFHSGNIGLRAVECAAKFRNLWIENNGKKVDIPLRRNSLAQKIGDVSGMWRPVISGSAEGYFTLETKNTFMGRQSQRLEFISGDGRIGIENKSLNRWGMCFRKDKVYEGYLWIKADKPADIYASLESDDGLNKYAETQLRINGNKWKRLEFSLLPDQDETNGRFVISIKKPGSVVVGHAFLQPGSWGRFKDLPVRKDIVDAMMDEGVTHLRYGGSMVDRSKEYRWKKMTGPRDLRPSYHGFWYPHSTNGWGIIDFLDLCEAAKFESVPSFNIDETGQDMADFVEYVNGPVDSPWGKKRAESGHPQPYGLKHLQIGNEQEINEYYVDRFKVLASAIWNKDPGMILVVADFWYPAHITDPYNTGIPSNKTLKGHEKILEFAKQNDKTVWFDVHIANDHPRDPDLENKGLVGLRDYISWMEKINPGADFKVVVLEENAGNHALKRALSHAHAVNELQRIKQGIPMVCAANGLQPYLQNDNDWDQGFIFFTPSKVWGQPPYYVTRMIAQNYLPLCIETETESPQNSLDVTAKMSDDRKILILQVVNLENIETITHISLGNFIPQRNTIHVTELAGNLEDVNTPDMPEKIKPVEKNYSFENQNGYIKYTFPPYSFTILHFM